MMPDPLIPAYRWLEVGPKLVEALREIVLTGEEGDDYRDMIPDMVTIAKKALALIPSPGPAPPESP